MSGIDILLLALVIACIIAAYVVTLGFLKDLHN